MGWKIMFSIVSVVIILGAFRTHKNQTASNINSHRQPITPTYKQNEFMGRLVKKCSQVTHIVIGMKECINLFWDMDEQHKVLIRMPMSKKLELEFQPLKSEAMSLVKMHLAFYQKIPHHTLEKFVEMWASGSKLGQDKLFQEIQRNKDIKAFMKTDSKLLTAEWKNLNLQQRFKECTVKLTDFLAHLPDEDISGEEVGESFETKFLAVADVIMQSDVPLALLGEINTAFKGVPETPESLGIAYSFRDIRQEFKVFLKMAESAYRTLKKAIKLWNEIGSVESISRSRLSSIESIKEAYAVNVEILQSELPNFIQRARDCLDEINACKKVGGRFYESL